MATEIEAQQAFLQGYHSERLPDAPHTVHSLRADAAAIAAALPEQNPEVEAAIHKALLHGIDVAPYEDAHRVFGNFATQGDGIYVWTTGDPRAQVTKVQKLGWDPALRNPDRPGDFIVYAAQDKHTVLPPMLNYIERTSRPRSPVVILDDDPNNLVQAHTAINTHGPLADRTHFVLMDRQGRHTNLPPFITPISSLAQYNEYIDGTRSSGSPVVHITDLDGTIIDPKASADSRQQAVIATLTQGISFSEAPRLTPKPFHDFHILDGSQKLVVTGNYKPTTPDTTTGHQARIFRAGDTLVKALAAEDDHRLPTPEWQELGGHKGTINLIEMLSIYRKKLGELGFPIPPDVRFFPARSQDGKFFPVEVVRDHGENLERVFLHGTPDEKRTMVREILEASYPLFMAKDIGADVKPANFVKGHNGIIHIDAFPVIMVNDSGEVTTEWPRITAPEIQDFLYKTNLTPLAIGYRFYQELCQLNPGMRSFYRQTIMDTVQGWQTSGKISVEMANAIGETMYPKTSRILDQVLSGQIGLHAGFTEINQELNAYTEKGEHPIYAIREMAFLLSEFLLHNGYDMNQISQNALSYVSREHSEEYADTIRRRVDKASADTKFLTVIRALTHLSNDSYVPGQDEETAYNIIQDLTEKIRYIPLPKEFERSGTSMPTTAELLGFSGKVIVESRLPTQQTPGYARIIANTPDAIGGDGMEVLIDPTVSHAIVPLPLDPDFVTYGRIFSGRSKMLIPVDHTRLTAQDVRDIVDYTPNGMFYSMWPVEELNSKQQVTNPDFQRRINEKASLADYLPPQYLPPGWQVVKHDDVYTLTEDNINQLKGGEEIIWAKAATWGFSSQGVKPCRSLEDVQAFAALLEEQGVRDDIVLEPHMPGLGGSFTLAKTATGEIIVTTVTDQLSNPDGKRIGNVIYSLNNADPAIQRMIAEVAETIGGREEFDPGFYVYDVVRDKLGKPYINDPAGRKSGTTPTAMLRHNWIAHNHLQADDVYAGQISLYLQPGVPFSRVFETLGSYTEFANNRQAIVRVHYDTFGRTTVKLALLSAHGQDSPEDIEKMKASIRQSFTEAGLLASVLS